MIKENKNSVNDAIERRRSKTKVIFFYVNLLISILERINIFKSIDWKEKFY